MIPSFSAVHSSHFPHLRASLAAFPLLQHPFVQPPAFLFVPATRVPLA
jgi:hypothetical protein